MLSAPLDFCLKEGLRTLKTHVRLCPSDQDALFFIALHRILYRLMLGCRHLCSTHLEAFFSTGRYIIQPLRTQILMKASQPSVVLAAGAHEINTYLCSSFPFRAWWTPQTCGLPVYFISLGSSHILHLTSVLCHSEWTQETGLKKHRLMMIKFTYTDPGGAITHSLMHSKIPAYGAMLAVYSLQHDWSVSHIQPHSHTYISVSRD